MAASFTHTQTAAGAQTPRYPGAHTAGGLAGSEPSSRQEDVDAHNATGIMAPLKTYIVEDSPVIRENLIATLEEMVPLQVVGTAEDEGSAQQWIGRRDNNWDLVIIDIFLKSGSGLGVVQAARQASHDGSKVVVLSNYATPDMRRKCAELGADKVFDKSNEIDALISYCIRLANGGDSGNSTFSSLA